MLGFLLAVSLSVDLTTQTLTVYDDQTVIAQSPVSTGKLGHETPTGVYQVKWKRADYRSKKYHAAMPYTIMFDTENGIALHAGYLPGFPASHGCVRLPPEFARWLYENTPNGTTVEVTYGTEY